MTTLEEAYAACEDITRIQARNFYYGIRLLPRRKRAALCAVYALARRIDDIGDGHLPRDTKLGQLAEVRKGVEPRDESDPVIAAVVDAATHFPIPLDAFCELIDGVEMDMRMDAGELSYRTFVELVTYCRCVAGSIGRLCVGVFDASDRPRADALAGDLGVALQLGNILRDLVEDLRNGRVYLPAADLARFGCRVDGAAIAGDAELVVAFEAERALGWLERGLGILPLLDRSSARCVRAMTAAYERMLTRIAEHPDRALSAHARLGSLEKRAVVARSLLRGAA
jgi:phytoene synthase